MSSRRVAAPTPKPITDLTHLEATRKNIPAAEVG